jgi:BolA protein
MPDIADEIRAALEVLAPLSVEITDDSGRHAGHRGASGGGHYRLKIVSAHFTGMKRVARHRAVYDTLASLMAHRIHALAIEALSPDESAH